MGELECALLPAKEVLAMADEIIGERLRLVNEPAEDTLTATQVAKTFNMTVFDFNAVLRDMGIQFTFEQAIQHSVAVKGANVNHNTVRMMLKNWRKQGLVFLTDLKNWSKWSRSFGHFRFLSGRSVTCASRKAGTSCLCPVSIRASIASCSWPSWLLRRASAFTRLT